jgi:hypothetical protein
MSKIVHFEISVDDAARAARFYEQAFGWQIERWQGPIDYWLVSTGAPDDPGVGGALRQRDELASGVVNHVGVDSVDAALERILAAGGEALTPKMPIPGVGFMAYGRDTEGNVLGVFQEDALAQ